MPRKAGPGRPRKPAAQKVLDGTYRKDRDGPKPAAAEAEPAEPVPDRPADLDGNAADFWDRVVPLLAGVARARDVPALAEVCRWWAEGRRVEVELAVTVPGSKGYKDLLICAGICTTNFDRLAAKFGFTPADRARLRAEPTPAAKPKVKTRPATQLDAKGKPT